MIVWLSSYPKSGNTWLRALLTSYYFSKDGKFDFSLLKNIDQFPSFDYFKDYKQLFSKPTDTCKLWLREQEKINKDKKIKFFKTHNALCKINGHSFTNKQNTLGVIYIIRDPRNVISSIAHHYQIDLNEAYEFMNTKNKAIIQKKGESYVGFVALFSYLFHHKSWVENTLYPTLVIKYEDLLYETFNTFKNVINFFNKITHSSNSFDKEKAKLAVSSTKFEKLRKLEEEQGFKESIISKKDGKNIKFFNLGKENQYTKLLSLDLVNKMNKQYKEILVKYNYE